MVEGSFFPVPTWSPGIGWSARSVDIPKPVVHRRTIEYPMIRRPAFADSAAIQAPMTAVVSTAEGSIQVRKQTADRNRISRLGLPADGPGYLRGRPMWLDGASAVPPPGG